MATHSPDTVRERLADIGTRRARGEATSRQAMDDLAGTIEPAIAAGLTIAEIARLAGVTRQTIYTITRRTEETAR